MLGREYEGGREGGREGGEQKRASERRGACVGKGGKTEWTRALPGLGEGLASMGVGGKGVMILKLKVFSETVKSFCAQGRGGGG